MLYQFTPAIQAGIEAGKYIPIVSSSGIPLSMVRDVATGKFVAHAVGLTAQGLTLTNPLTSFASPMLMGIGQFYQGQRIIQSLATLSASVATLQATTAVIGVGVATTVVLSAVNLWQTRKLRKEVAEMRMEIQEGFVDLKRVLADQGAEIIRHIQKVAEDVEFKHHRTILVKAYGRFDKALDRLKSAITVQDQSVRLAEITAARDMLFEALADYNNNQILSNISSAAYLRRRECVWAIEQTIAMTYQLQGEFETVKSRLINLENIMRSDAVNLVDSIKEEWELDFLYPELLYIHNHDLATVIAWQAHADFYQHMSLEEANLLKEFNPETSGLVDDISSFEELVEEVPLEYQLYEEAQKESHYVALEDSLVFLMASEQRNKAIQYVSEQADLKGLKALNQENLTHASPLALANLLSYFYSYDDSIEDDDNDHEEVLEEVAS